MAANVFSGPDPSPESKTTLLYDVAAVAFSGATVILALVVGSYHKVGTFEVETDFYRRYAVETQNILAELPYTDLLHPPGIVGGDFEPYRLFGTR